MSLLYRTIQSHIKDFENNLYTTIPSKVIAFDQEECTVDVSPSVNNIDRDGVVIINPVLYRVPLLMPNAFNSALTFPLKEGDKVLLHFCHSNIEDYLLQSTQSNPDNITPSRLKKHDSDDCFATLGVRFYDDSPIKRSNTLDLYYGDSRLTIEEDGSINLRHTKDQVDSYLSVLPNGEATITNDEHGSKITLKNDGNINVTTKRTISVNNDSVELISLLSDLIGTLANTTVNTVYGQSILNSKPQLQNLKSQLDTLKE